jgi:hypothetical protein
LRSEAEPALRRALSDKISLEQRRRIEEILARPSWQVVDPELLRGIRALEVLEHIATRGGDAHWFAVNNLLKRLADGAPEARLTREARATKQRLDARKP